MGLLEAIILGIVQGLTEFLPVSSSGHLEIGKALFGDESLPRESLLFTVAVHFATAASTVVVFRKDITQLLRGLLSLNAGDEFWFSVKITLSMIPAAAVGLAFNDAIESMFSGQLFLVGTMLTVTAALLHVADKAKTTVKDVSVLNALILGVAQAIAILPGISRSGATISTAVMLGVDREKAARFSFLMVVPLIFGKMAKDLMDGTLAQSSLELLPIAAAALAAFVSGIVACRWMIALVRQSQLRWFGYYCLAAGVTTIIVSVL